MKIAIVNTSDATGGAAIACRRLLKAFNYNGIEAKLLVQEKKTNNENSVANKTGFFYNKLNFYRFALEYLYFNKIEKRKNADNVFSTARLGVDISKHKIIQEADIINLHWTNNSYLNFNALKKLFALKKSVVWHLHDMWAFTGGCHYSGTCNHFLKECGNCHLLKWSGENDLSKKMWNSKSHIYKNARLTIVTPSQWLGNIAKQSSLLNRVNIHTIPNPIDINTFKPIDKKLAKQQLGLNANTKYILFAAMNVQHTRKGFEYLKQSITHLKNQANTELLVIGKVNEAIIQQLNLKANCLGVISGEEKMNVIYNAADVYVTPSLEDNLPNTVMESLACGTPVAAFNTGGIPEMVDHEQNGYIAKYESSADLAKGILYILNHPNYQLLSDNAIKKVILNFSEEIVAKKYTELFNSLIK